MRGPVVSLDPAEVERAIAVTAYGGFLVAQEAARRMLPHANGAILFTGASASVKGYAQSAPFAMGKFALRGLAQSMARELQPQGIHVAHFVIDGGIRSAARPAPADKPDSLLDPDGDRARTTCHVLRQPRSAWTWEIEVGRGWRSSRREGNASRVSADVFVGVSWDVPIWCQSFGDYEVISEYITYLRTLCEARFS